MVRSHTKNELFVDGKKRNRLETNGDLTGRPRIRWLDDVCNDMKLMNVKNWKELALNRKAWNDLFEKAKTHKWL
jgi:hypothetical protein